MVDRTGKPLALAAAGFLLLAATAAAAPLRLLLPPAPARVEAANLRLPENRARLVMQLYLDEWFSQAPDVLMVDSSQAAALLEQATGPAWMRSGTGAFAAVNALLPVDALVTLEVEEAQATVVLHRAAGEKRLALLNPASPNWPVQLARLTDFLVDELHLSRIPSPLDRDLPQDHSAAIENGYVSQRLWAPWISNSGEARLELLHAYQSRLPNDTFMAAAIIDAATWMTLDKRVVKEPARWVLVAQHALLSLLGTAREPAAIHFCRHNQIQPELIEKGLVDIIAKLGRDEVDALLDDDTPATGALTGLDGLAPRLDGAPALLDAAKTPAQQAGAIRCLGAMQSTLALPHLTRMAAAPVADAGLRQAIATALAEYPGESGLAALATLANDDELAVAFEANHSLWRRGQHPPRLLDLARQQLAARPDHTAALDILARLGTNQDALRLRHYLTDPAAPRRLAAVHGLLRLELATDDEIEGWFADPATTVVNTALASLPAARRQPHRQSLVRLGNHPHAALAEAARLALAPLLPTNHEQRQLFELTFEHPYVRRQLIDRWAKQDTAAALAGLQAAVDNPDPHTRALAIAKLAERNPQLAHPHLEKLLADPHRLVRLQAAAVAAIAAQPDDLPMLEEALAAQIDEAARLYLHDALALAKGEPPPPAGRPVNRVDASRAMSFNCGWTAELDRSPFDGFYGLHLPKPEEIPAMRRAHAAGKVFLLRANQTAKNPAQVLLHPYWRDGFWLGLDAEFGELWDTIDGLVLGEESMYFRPFNEWANGWRLFCRDAGIDPHRVNGDREKLAEPEKQAWWDWEQRLAIDGFNAIYDYVKLRYAKQHPGMQVATFMPDQNGPCDYDRDWKFDIAAGYYYAAPTRTRYASIRRLKTVWPERPVLWLNQGKVGVGIGLNLTSIQHTTAVPTSPLHRLTDITSADSTAAWLAGAHPGLFAIYLFVHVGWRGEDFGVWVQLDDLTPTSPVFAKAIEHSFRGLAEKYRLEAAIKEAKPTTDLVGGTANQLDLTLDEPDDAPDEFAQRASRERETFRRGFLLERKLVQDTVNLFSAIPFPTPDHPVLLVGPRDMRAPGFDLANGFDCLFQLNKLGETKLDTYRFVGLTGQDETPLRPATIAALSAWLQHQPGLLYIHGWLSTDPNHKAHTVDDLDQPLPRNWPWATAVEPIFASQTQRRRERNVTVGYRVHANQATVLHEVDGTPVLVFWKAPDWPGGVLLHAGQLDSQALQTHLNRLATEQQIGLAFAGPIGLLGTHTPDFDAMVSDRATPAPHRLAGVDALTGSRQPEIKPGRAAAVLARQWHGRFAAAANGVTALADQPIDAREAVAGGLRIKSTGVIQAVAEHGSLRCQSATGTLPTIEPDNLLEWLVASDAPGQIVLQADDQASPVTLLRAPGWLTLTTQEAP